MNNNYESWFSKWNGWTDGQHTLSVSKFNWNDALVRFTLRKQGRSEALHFALNHICAVSKDGERALPSFAKEDEVDAQVKDWLWHGRNLFEVK